MNDEGLVRCTFARFSTSAFRTSNRKYTVASTTGAEFLSTGSTTSLSIQAPALTFKPFTVTGPRGALLGQQNGTYEAWIFPWKIFSDMRITAQMKDYSVPIDVNEQAATIDVQPDHTTITFSHANFTLREILLTPQHAPEGAGALVLYQIEAVRPLTLTFSFTPEMKRMWPAPSDNRPSPEWVQTGTSGFYILHLDSLGHTGAWPCRKRSQAFRRPIRNGQNRSLEFVLHFDPDRDSKKLFPLLMTARGNRKGIERDLSPRKLAALQTSFVNLYNDTQAYYRTALAEQTSIETPDAKLNEAFRWAEVAIEQLRVETTPTRGETALVAGFYSSGDSSRPGFGWYFGRDSLWTLYAINSYGDFKLSRDEFEFLMHRQRADGKMPHEWSQTADLVDWKSLPYEYASADGTLLFLMAMDDYLRVSGDKAFVEKNWDSLQRAWTFATSHDSDGDGIYENTEGTGGWNRGRRECRTRKSISPRSTNRPARRWRISRRQPVTRTSAKDAESRAQHISEQVEKEYLLPGGSFYAFSRNADGTVDKSPTIYPAVAAWDGTYNLKQMQPVLNRWASSEFSTDWGTRDLSPTVSLLRSHQLSPGHGVAALYRLGISFGIPQRPQSFRLLAPYAKRGPDVGPRSRRCNRVALRRIFRAPRPQHFAPAVVIRDGDFARHAWPVRRGMGCGIEHSYADTKSSCRLGPGQAKKSSPGQQQG